MKLEEDIRSAVEEFEPGRRSRRRRAKRRRGRAIAIISALALAVAGLWAGVRSLTGPGKATLRHAGANDRQTAYLFMVRREEDPTRMSDMLVVFAVDRNARNSVAMLIPSTSVTEVPGHGDSELAGRGYSFGGMGLQSLVVDNMLGIELDKSASMTDDVLAKMVDQVGGLQIDVQGPLLAPGDTLIAAFEDGPQHMDGATVKRYLRYQGSDETELSRLARAQQVWDELIQAWGRIGQSALAQKFESLGHESGQGLETGLSPAVLAEFFRAFAGVGEDNRVYTTLPVTPVSGGGDSPVLRVDEDQVSSLVQQYFEGSIPDNPYRGIKLQVLNANGVPEIGAQIGFRLIPLGFRFVLNRNARSFDQEQTKIIVYDRSERMMGAARKIQNLLGVGEIEIGIQTQSLVDVTVVVGHDFNPGR